MWWECYEFSMGGNYSEKSGNNDDTWPGGGFVKKVQWLAAFFKTFVFDEIYNLHNQQEDDFSAFSLIGWFFQKINWT